MAIRVFIFDKDAYKKLLIFFATRFCHFYPVQSNGIKFQVQGGVFLTYELNSMHNFSLENIFYSCFE